MAKSSKIGYLGPEGTYSHEAAVRWIAETTEVKWLDAAGNPLPTPIPLPSIRAVFDGLRDGKVEHGIVPIENSTEGTVRTTLDCFIACQSSGAMPKITGETLEKIDLHLLGTKGALLKNVQTVYAHEQAIAQARNWLNGNLPGVLTVAMSSNAAAAKKVVGDPSSVAIGSSAASVKYKLSVLYNFIQDAKDNTTRFILLGRKELPYSSRISKYKTSLLASAAHQPGTLLKLLQPLSKYGINMTLLESRPALDTNWEYKFFIEVEGHHAADPLKSALLAMRKMKETKITVLGSYPAAA